MSASSSSAGARPTSVNPTDRFAPRDFLSVTDNLFLAVTAARLAFGGDAHLVEAVWVPFFTPSRIPLYDRRWTVLLPPLQDLQLIDLGAEYPEGSQVGFRWNHVASGYEYSLSYYDGLGQTEYSPLLKPGTFLKITMNLPGNPVSLPGTVLSATKIDEFYRLSLRFGQNGPEKTIIFHYMVDRRSEIENELRQSYQSALG